jgi:hypothetical protein
MTRDKCSSQKRPSFMYRDEEAHIMVQCSLYPHVRFPPRHSGTAKLSGQILSLVVITRASPWLGLIEFLPCFIFYAATAMKRSLSYNYSCALRRSEQNPSLTWAPRDAQDVDFMRERVRQPTCILSILTAQSIIKPRFRFPLGPLCFWPLGERALQALKGSQSAWTPTFRQNVGPPTLSPDSQSFEASPRL